MLLESWSIERWKEIAEIGGSLCAILFTGVALHIDARVRRAQTLIEITKQHRDLWSYFDDHPELFGLFDVDRNLRTKPLTRRELRFANFLFLHLRASYGAKRAGIHVLPEHVEDDWKEIFANPAMSASWSQMKHLHDRRFVELVEKFRRDSPPIGKEYPASLKRGLNAEFEQPSRPVHTKP
jgi:hypothetical protein